MADLSLRGRCHELAKAAVAADPTLRLVRGWYVCSIWGGRQGHWWTVRPDGTIHDPTAAQFDSNGVGEYIEFDGIVECEECGTRLSEEAAIIRGHHVWCCDTCYGIGLGLLDPETRQRIHDE